MNLYIGEHQVKDPTLGCLAIKVIGATGLPSRQYIYIVNKHQIDMVLEERHKYIIHNLVLKTSEGVIVMTSNGLGFEKIPAIFITKWLRSNRKIYAVSALKTLKGYKLVDTIEEFSLFEVIKLIELRDEQVKGYLKGTVKTIQSPKDFIIANAEKVKI